MAMVPAPRGVDGPGLDATPDAHKGRQLRHQGSLIDEQIEKIVPKREEKEERSPIAKEFHDGKGVTDKYANKIITLDGIEGNRSELNGHYHQLKKPWGKFPCFLNKENQVYLVRDLYEPKWKVVKKLGSRVGMLGVRDPAGLPWNVTRMWYTISSAESGKSEVPAPKIRCTLKRGTVIFSGRAGFQSRLNGVFTETCTDYAGFPAYFDEKSHKYCFNTGSCFWWNKDGKPRWVISNRLGKPLRNREPVRFAEACEDVSRPYLVESAWYVPPWGGEDGEQDDQICCSLRSEMRDAKPAEYMLVKSRSVPQVCGGYKLQEEKHNDMAVYFHSPGRNPEPRYLFHDSFRWCIAAELGASEDKCDVFGEERGREHRRISPEDTVWRLCSLQPVVSAKAQQELRFEGRSAWLDPEFPPSPSSVGMIPSLGALSGHDALQWCRAPDCISGQLVLFDSIEPGDAMQGALGDCWLMSAIAAIAEFPGSIESLFVTKDIVPEGRYVLRMWDLETKEWQDLPISDNLPCIPRKPWERVPTPAFSQSPDDELYMLLLEKAFAKLAGSFGNLSGGHHALAWQVMTGQEEQWGFERKQAVGQASCRWSKHFVVAAPGKPRRFQGVELRPAGETFTDEDMFRLLCRADEDNFVMGAVIPASGETTRSDGLVAGHAYSLITVLEIDGIGLLKLRNPWGGEWEWNGKWSDVDFKTWKEHPSIKAQLHGDSEPDDKDDGTFWMEWTDLIARFSQINVCPKSMEVRRGTHRESEAGLGQAGRRPGG